jgi:hypothetical protein
VTGQSFNLSSVVFQAFAGEVWSRIRLQTQATKHTEMKMSSLRIYSAHINMKFMKIEVTAPWASLAMISFSEYFLMPEPKTPSTSFLRR